MESGAPTRIMVVWERAKESVSRVYGNNNVPAGMNACRLRPARTATLYSASERVMVED